MHYDPYSPCPCGSGQKFKFCCPRDLQAEYLRIYDLLASDQRSAAGEHADRLLARFPDQPCLLVAKATVLVQLDETEQLAKVSQRLAAVAPRHPAAPALAGLQAAQSGDDALVAIERLQDSLELVEGDLPELVEWALEVLIVRLWHDGRWFEALGQAHILIDLAEEGKLSANTTQIIAGIHRDASYPLVCKDFWFERLRRTLSVAGVANFESHLARGHLRRLRDDAAAWLQREPGQPAARLLLALLQAYLGNEGQAVPLLREFADMPAAPERIAVDALLLAHALEPAEVAGGPTTVMYDYPVPDVERLMERLLSESRLAPYRGDLTQLAAEGQPPPKAVFLLLDRPFPAEAPRCAGHELPHSIGSLLVYGRQTDREAHLEVSRRGGDARGESELAELLGDAVQPLTDRRVLEHLDALLEAAVQPVMLPPNTSPYDAPRLQAENLDHAISQTWPESPHPFLRGWTPRSAAADPALRRPLLAALIHLETTPPIDSWRGDFAAFWSQFGLTHDLRPEEFASLDEVGVTQLVRVDPAQLADRDLTTACFLGAARMARRACERMTLALLQREAFLKDQDLSVVFLQATDAMPGNERQLSYVRRLIPVAEALNQIPGAWHVHELVLLFRSGWAKEATEKLELIFRRYRRDRATMELVDRVLREVGLVGPDGQLRGMAPPGEAEAATPVGSAIWTPDQVPASGTVGNEPARKLWLPGME